MTSFTFTIALSLGLILLVFLTLSDRRRLARKHYESLFGLPFPTNRLERFIQQPAVNMRLREFAEDFHQACMAKDQITNGLPAYDKLASLDAVKRSLSDLDNAESVIRYRKRIFWRAHSLAKRAGMWTMKRVGDYRRLKEHVY